MTNLIDQFFRPDGWPDQQGHEGCWLNPTARIRCLADWVGSFDHSRPGHQESWQSSFPYQAKYRFLDPSCNHDDSGDA